jgi:energy-coupling factor transporter ATP-binding protein EcfA2
MVEDKILSSLNIVNSTCSNINTEYHVREKEKENIIKAIEDFNFKMINIEERVKHLEETKILLETLKTYKLQEKKDFILKIINTALTDIFNDKVYIDIEAQDKKTSKGSTQKYDIVFYQNDIEMARNEELLVTNGGGIMQVISMLFKILIGYIYSKNTFYIFDESFSQLSGENRTRLSKFLKNFCDKFDFTLVVVSQVQDLDEYADIIYDVDGSYNNQGVRTLHIVNKKLPENILTGSGYWQLDIENFQSIKKETFQFKGYTIIRGPNNSGKSASLRAINSILYNSFDVKKYPRKAFSSTGSRRNQSCSIELSKHSINHETGHPQDKSIILNFKNQKVSFVIEGHEYYGKNLAGNKLKEAVENIGFKYINLKEFYKNFKGNLKDQTERIASTTQYDSLFLVGNKGSETEKVFNFLFNTENISMGILKIKEDMVELNKQYKDYQEIILEKTKRLNKVEKEITILSTLYYILSIREFLELNVELTNTQKIINGIKLKIDKRNNYIEKFQKIEPLFDGGNMDYSILSSTVQEMEDLKNKKFQYENRLVKIDKILNKTPKVIELLDFQSNLRNGIETLESFDIQSIDNNVNSLTTKMKKIEQFQEKAIHISYIKESLDYIVNMETFIKEDSEKIKEAKYSQESLKNKYGIESCNQCSGYGYIHYYINKG